MGLIRTKESRRAIAERKRKGITGNPHNFKDETGQKYGRLTVICAAGYWKHTNEVTWLCQCECGKPVVVRGISLRAGDSQSCGCIHKEKLSKRNKAKLETPLRLEYKQIVTELRDQGLPLSEIADEMMHRNLPTVTGKKIWFSSTVANLLKN